MEGFAVPTRVPIAVRVPRSHGKRFETYFLDIAPFIEVLSVDGFLEAADINQDGEVNFLDIFPFIERICGCLIDPAVP